MKNVVITGAGVSTESGMADFRSIDGLYNQQWKYPPEEIISHSFFYKDTKEFYRFYRAKLLPTGFEPNAAHKKLAEMEKVGKLKAIVTQNIDGLHQKAGSERGCRALPAEKVRKVFIYENSRENHAGARTEDLADGGGHPTDR